MRTWRPLSQRLCQRGPNYHQLNRPRPKCRTLPRTQDQQLRCQHRHSSSFSQPISVAKLLAKDDVTATAPQDVEVRGWIRSVRKQKRVAFAVVGDGSTAGAVQAVLKPEMAADLSYNSAVSLQGQWRPCPPKPSSTSSTSPQEQQQHQTHELHVTQVTVLGANDPEHNPLQPKNQTAEFLRTIPHLRMRTPANALLLRLRSGVIASLTRFFEAEDYVQCHTPVVTSSDCEGAGEVFSVVAGGEDGSVGEPIGSPQLASSSSSDSAAADGNLLVASSSQSPQQQQQHFFRTPKYLTVSAQLHLEALAHAVSRVWTLSPTFRAERSDTPRHLSEFYMLEAEVCFTEHLEDVMGLVERMLQAVATDLLASKVGAEMLKVVGKGEAVEDQGEGESVSQNSAVSAEQVALRWKGLAQGNWPRVTYADAIVILQEAVANGKVQFAVSPTWDNGLDAEHERYLTHHFNSDTDGTRPLTPVFVTHYPATQKPFYMLPTDASADASSPSPTVENFDLLVPSHLELAGGSLRTHDLDTLQAAMRAKGVSEDRLQWYMDLRRFGAAPHGGFGLGLDRLLGYLSGRGSVRDVVSWPRWAGRCDG